MPPIIRLGLKGIKELKAKIVIAEERGNALELIDLYDRLFIMFNSVLDDFIREYGERSSDQKRSNK